MFCVMFGGTKSSIAYIICSLTQCSVMCPLLFIVYIAEKHDISLHTFDDDMLIIFTVIVSIWHGLPPD